MGCFLACLGSSKNRKRRKPAKRVQPRAEVKLLQGYGSYEPLESNESPEQQIVEKPITPISVSRNKLEDQLRFKIKKKVTFDLNVKVYERVSCQEFGDSLLQCEDEEEEQREKEKTQLFEDNLGFSSMGCFPSNHRYGNCIDSDDEYEEVESDLSDFDEEDDEDYDEVEEVTCPLILNQVKKTHSVLNPVENLTQWKAAKIKTPSPLVKEKENIQLEIEPNPELAFKQSSSPFSFNSRVDQSFSFNTKIDQTLSLNSDTNQSSTHKQEIAMDASISTWWLSSCQSTNYIASGKFPIESGFTAVNKSQRSHSSTNREDRPLLSALTL